MVGNPQNLHREEGPNSAAIKKIQRPKKLAKKRGSGKICGIIESTPKTGFIAWQ